MKMKTRTMKMFFCLGCFLPFFAWAEPHLTDKSVLFFGMDVGLSHVSTDVETELDKTGVHFGLKVGISHYFSKFGVHGNVGWLYNWVKGSSKDTEVISETIGMKAGFLELSPTVRLTPEVELGLSSMMWFGTDTHFSYDGEVENRMAFFLGPVVSYLFPSSIPVRLNFSGLLDANISERNVLLVLFGVQIGFPFSLGSREKIGEMPPMAGRTEILSAAKEEVEKKEKEGLPPSTPLAMESLPTSTPKPIPSFVSNSNLVQPVVWIPLNEEHVYFDPDHFNLDETSIEHLASLTKFLSNHLDAWRMVQIFGHSDQTGTTEYNQQLARKRAESVRDLLVYGGVPQEKIQVVSKEEAVLETSLSKPRIDLVFDQVSNPTIFEQTLKEIQESWNPQK